MSKKYYAVRKGFNTGIFNTWDACKAQVDGFSGAEYKGFNDEEEAHKYLKSKGITVSPDAVSIYTGNNYSPSRINSGVIIKSNIKQYDIHGSIKLSDANNISGELLSALIGINLAVDLGFSELNIIYSYDGVRKWATEEWQPKSNIAIQYLSAVNNLLSEKAPLNISFFSKNELTDKSLTKYASSLSMRAKAENMYIDTNKILQG